MSPLEIRGATGGAQLSSRIHSSWARKRRAPSDSPCGELLARLQDQRLLEKLPSWARSEIGSIQQESQVEMLGESLLAIGRRLSQAGQDEAAMLVFSVAEAGGKTPPLQKIAQRAREELDIFLGRGPFEKRVEFLGSRLAAETTSLSAIAGIAAGLSVATMCRAGFLSRLLARPAEWWTRGWGGRALASSGAFLFEVPALWGATKLLHQTLEGESKGNEGGSDFQEVLGTGILLGGMKFGLGSMAALQAHHPLFHHVGLLAGLWIGDRALSLIFSNHVEASGADLVAKGFQFALAGRLTRGLFGTTWTRWLQELELRVRQGDGHLSGGAVDGGTPSQVGGLLRRAAVQGIEARGRSKPGRDLEVRTRAWAMAGRSGLSGSQNIAPGEISPQEFLKKAEEVSHGDELKALKNELVRIYTTANKSPLSENLARYERYQNPEDWKILIRIISGMLENERYEGVLENDEGFQNFRARWEAKHLQNPPVVEERVEALIPEPPVVREPPVPKPPPPVPKPPPPVPKAASSPNPPPASHHRPEPPELKIIARRADEGWTDYAFRVQHESLKGPRFFLATVRMLVNYLQRPEWEPFARQALEQIAKFTKSIQEGSGIVIRRYPLGDSSDSLTTLVLPSSFSPAQWAEFLGEDFQQAVQFRSAGKRSKVEVDFGAGWLLIRKPELEPAGSADGDFYPFLIAGHKSLAGGVQSLLGSKLP